MRKLDKKGQVLGNLQQAIMGFGTIVVVLAIILFIVNGVGTAMPENSNAQNATKSIETKLAGADVWIGILVIVVFATAVMSYFYMRG